MPRNLPIKLYLELDAQPLKSNGKIIIDLSVKIIKKE